MHTDSFPPDSASPAKAILPRDLQFDAAPYQPDGGFSGPGLIMLKLGLGAAGIGLGALVHVVGQWIYLVVLFPIAIGCFLGGLGAYLIKAGKVRSPIMASLAGLVAALLCFFTQQYLDYCQFLKERDMERLEFKANLQQNEQFQKIIQKIKGNKEFDDAVAAMQVKSFPEYIDFRAQVGVTIKKLNLGYYGTYIYWMVELLIITGIVFSMVRKTAREPFCPLTHAWKTERCGTHFQIPAELGAEAIAAALQEGAIGKISEVKNQTGQDTTGNMIPMRLYVYASPQHEEPCTVDVRLASLQPGKQDSMEEKELAMVTYPAKALASLETLCR